MTMCARNRNVTLPV